MIEFNNEKLGKKILEIRTEKDITQDELADRMDSSRVVLSRIESGERGCSVDYLIKIANALEVSSDMLLVDFLARPEISPDAADITRILSGCTKEESTLLIAMLACLRKDVTKFIIG